MQDGFPFPEVMKRCRRFLVMIAVSWVAHLSSFGFSDLFACFLGSTFFLLVFWGYPFLLAFWVTLFCLLFGVTFFAWYWNMLVLSYPSLGRTAGLSHDAQKRPGQEHMNLEVDDNRGYDRGQF
jgi:membrane protein implicated in regulation of membrane protease activity